MPPWGGWLRSNSAGREFGPDVFDQPLGQPFARARVAPMLGEFGGESNVRK